MSGNADAAEYGLYAPTTRALHWLMVVLIVAAVALGLWAASLERSDPVREEILFYHKSLGLTLLALAIVRLLWVLKTPGPKLPASLPPIERGLAKVVHVALYILLFAVPLSGILLSQAAGREISFFGLFELPRVLPVDESVPPAERPLVIAGAITHKVVFKFALFAIVALHVIGALKHLVADRDVRMFRRMWG